MSIIEVRILCGSTAVIALAIGFFISKYYWRKGYTDAEAARYYSVNQFNNGVQLGLERGVGQLTSNADIVTGSKYFRSKVFKVLEQIETPNGTLQVLLDLGESERKKGLLLVCPYDILVLGPSTEVYELQHPKKGKSYTISDTPITEMQKKLKWADTLNNHKETLFAKEVEV